MYLDNLLLNTMNSSLAAFPLEGRRVLKSAVPISSLHLKLLKERTELSVLEHTECANCVRGFLTAVKWE